MVKPKWLTKDIDAVFNWKVRTYKHLRITILQIKNKEVK